MDENRSPAERLLDLVVFGPAGLALTATEEFPKLVDKGRQHLEGQVRTARLVGQVAFQMGRRQIDQFVSQRTAKPATPAPAPAPPKATPPTPSAPVTPTAASEGGSTVAPDVGPTAEKSATTNGSAAATKTAATKTAATNGSPVTHGATKAATKSPPVNGVVADGSVAGSLAIPGYDSLSASQVVQRLAGLSPAELIEVRAHEQAQRHRRTILNRVEQLLAGVDAD